MLQIVRPGHAMTVSGRKNLVPTIPIHAKQSRIISHQKGKCGHYS